MITSSQHASQPFLHHSLLISSSCTKLNAYSPSRLSSDNVRSHRKRIAFLEPRISSLINTRGKYQDVLFQRWREKNRLPHRRALRRPLQFETGRIGYKGVLYHATNNSSADEEEKGSHFTTNNSSADEEEKGSHFTETGSTKLCYKSDWTILERWDVPWDGKTVVVTVASFGASFLLTGLTLAVLAARLGYGRRQYWDLDDQALSIFINQLLQTVVGIVVLNSCLSRYKPLPNDFFNYDWKNPFDVQNGWLLWGGVGVVGGAAAVLLAGTLASTLNGQPMPREEQDALVQLLPLIGASKTSTVLLVVVTGILAPYLEETFFRGFLMSSFTKWMSTPIAVVLSASAFALAHFTPGETPQLFGLGIVLGFAYAKTRNLLTPIMIHAFWNSGVVLTLTYLSLQGYDLRELI